MSGTPVLGLADGIFWYNFSVVLFWVGMVLLVLTAIRAALLSKQDLSGRPWWAGLKLAERRAVGRRRSYQ